MFLLNLKLYSTKIKNVFQNIAHKFDLTCIITLTVV